MAVADSPLERLYTLRQLQAAGYGDRMTLIRRIHEGKIPAVKVNNAFKIRERHLKLIAKTLSGPEVETPVIAVADLSELVKSLVDAYPTLDAERKRELGALLTSTPTPATPAALAA